MAFATLGLTELAMPISPLLLNGFIGRDFARGATAGKACLENVEIINDVGFGRGAHAIGKENAIEVIEFMLDAAGEQSTHFRRDFITIHAIGVDVYCFGTHDGAVKAGKAQAALFSFFGTLGGTNDRIDEDELFTFVGRSLEVDDEEPDGKVYLIGSESNSLGGVHEIKHLPHNGT